jgi:hypothetical protein
VTCATLAIDPAILAALVADVRRRADYVAFEPGPHRYTVNGLVKPSVTQVIDGAGYRDTRFMQDRTVRGRVVHEATLHHEDGILDFDALAPEHRGYAESYAAWFDTTRPTALLREQVVYDQVLDVTGTLDRLFLCADGWLEVMDFKAGVPQPWHTVQTAGYDRLIFAGDFADLPRRRSSLILRPDGKPAKRIPHETDHDDTAAFLNAVGCHHWRDRYVPA